MITQTKEKELGTNLPVISMLYGTESSVDARVQGGVPAPTVVHLEMRISPRIFERKNETTLIGYSGAWGKLIHEKNLKWEISWHFPLRLVYGSQGGALWFTQWIRIGWR
jgi:hypothetical protein